MSNDSWYIKFSWIIALFLGIIVFLIDKVEFKLPSYIIVVLVGSLTIFYIVYISSHLPPRMPRKFQICLAIIVGACSFFTVNACLSFIFPTITDPPRINAQVSSIISFAVTTIIGMMAIILGSFTHQIVEAVKDKIKDTQKTIEDINNRIEDTQKAVENINNEMEYINTIRKNINIFPFFHKSRFNISLAMFFRLCFFLICLVLLIEILIVLKL